MFTPTLGPDCGKERLKVADRKENVAFETEAGTRKNGIPQVLRHGSERVGLHHAANPGQLVLGLGVIDLVDKGHASGEGEISPVRPVFAVAIVGVRILAEHLHTLLTFHGRFELARGCIQVRVHSTCLGTVRSRNGFRAGLMMRVVRVVMNEIVSDHSGQQGTRLVSRIKLVKGKKDIGQMTGPLQE